MQHLVKSTRMYTYECTSGNLLAKNETINYKRVLSGWVESKYLKVPVLQDLCLFFSCSSLSLIK